MPERLQILYLRLAVFEGGAAGGKSPIQKYAGIVLSTSSCRSRKPTNSVHMQVIRSHGERCDRLLARVRGRVIDPAFDFAKLEEK